VCFDHRVLTGGRGSLNRLASILPRVWCCDTAWIDDWDERNPARGQCGTTALVVQDLYGGALATGIVNNGSDDLAVHYWNVLSTGPVDLTWQQFAPSAQVLRCQPVDRDYLLRTGWFVDRYEALRDRSRVLLDEDVARWETVEIKLCSVAEPTRGAAPRS
jgi:hypothetical protein